MDWGVTGLYWFILGALGDTGLYWVILGYTGSTGGYWFILVHTGLYWFILGYTGLYWVILVYTGLYWVILVYTGLYWVILVYTGLYWVILVYTGLYWFILGYTGLYWVILVYTGLYWVILGYTGLYWVILVYTGLYWFILVYTGSTLGLLGYTGLYWSVLVHTGPYWFILVRTGLYCSILVYTGLYWLYWEHWGVTRGVTGPYWFILGYTGLYWFILGYTGPYWFILVHTGPYWSILVHTGSYWFSLGAPPGPAERRTGQGQGQRGHGKALLWKRLLRDWKSRGGTRSDPGVVAAPEGDSPGGSPVSPPGLELSGDGVVVRPVHGSVAGESFCFQVRPPSGSRSFSCASRAERDRWMEELRRVARPGKDSSERLELSLTLWIYEGRDLPARRRLRCHLQLDGAIFARTTAKPSGADGQLFWGELFHLPALPPARALTVALCRDDHAGCRPLAAVTIPLAELAAARQPLERWYPLSGAGGERAPALRLGGRYRQVRVLPIVRYKELAEFITFHYRELCGRLEPLIAARHKEELAGALVRVLQSTGKAKVGRRRVRGWGWVGLGWVGLG
uniref:C2 domain-containing protein n=1 Tax=Taeniopygia guttata TaxID=59729 RepID=A0A674G8R3_TAEGU